MLLRTIGKRQPNKKAFSAIVGIALRNERKKMLGDEGIGKLSISEFHTPERYAAYFTLKFNSSMLDPSVATIANSEEFCEMKKKWSEENQAYWDFETGEEAALSEASFLFDPDRKITPEVIMMLLDMSFGSQTYRATSAPLKVRQAFEDLRYTVSTDICGYQRNYDVITDDLIFLAMLPLQLLQSFIELEDYRVIVHVIPDVWKIEEDERRRTIILEVPTDEPITEPAEYLDVFAEELGVEVDSTPTLGIADRLVQPEKKDRVVEE